MTSETHAPNELDLLRSLLRHKRFTQILYLLFLLAVPCVNSFAQVLNVTQASVLQGFEGKVPNLTGASAVFVQGNYAYVVGTGNMLQIFDITLPGLPVPKGVLYHGTGGASILRAQNIVVRDNYAYITSYGEDAFEIVDVSDPSKPVHKAALFDGKGSAPYLKGAWDLQLVGDYAYVVSTSSLALEIIDISNPSNPRHAASLLDGAGDTSPHLAAPVTIEIKDNLAYIGNLGGTTISSKLQVVDISNSTQPTPVGDITLGNNQFPYTHPIGIAIAGNYAYVTDWWNGALETIDISNPALPVHSSMLVNADPNVLTPGVRNPPYLYGAWAIQIAGNYAYIGLNTNIFDPTDVIKNEYVGGLEVVDISNPAVPVHAGAGIFSRSTRSCREIQVVGDKVYMPGRIAGTLSIVSIAQPTTPTILSTATRGPGGAIISTPSTVLVDGNYAYIGNRGENATNGPGSLEIVNISDPTRPVHEGSIDVNGGASLFGTAALSKFGNFVYVVSNLMHSIQVIDVTIPSVPVRRGVLRSTQTIPPIPIVGVKAISMTISNLAFVASGRYRDSDGIVKQGSNSIASINLVDTNAPGFSQALVDGGGTAPYLNDPSSIASLPAEPFLYVASTGSNALEVVGTSPLAHAGALLDGGGTAPYLNQPVSVAVQGNYAYVASAGSKALEIVNITNRANPVHAGAFLDGQQGVSLEGINNVRVSGNFAYLTVNTFVSGFLASKPSSLVVIDISNPAAPVHVDTFFDREGGAILDGPTSLFISGPYAYMTNSGLSMNLNIAYLFGPKITNIQPASAPVGSSVTITGENFNTFLTATVNGTPAAVTNVTATTLTFTVPPGATNGKIGLTLNGQTISSANNFIVTPTAAAATTVQQTSFTANWSDVGAAEYFFDLSTDNFTSFLTGFSNQSVGNVTSLAISGLNSGTSYQYRVRSSDGAVISSNSNAVSVLTIPATPVINPSTDFTQNSFKISWGAVTGATGYRLDVASDDAFTQFLTGLENLSVSSNAQIINVGSSGTFYYYRVRAVNASGTSPSSTVGVAVTIPAAPAVAVPLEVTPNGFRIQWAPSVGATEYRIDVSADNFSTFIADYQNRSNGSATTASIDVLAPGTTYQYRVRAANNSGSSESSSVISVITLPVAPEVTFQVSAIGSSSFTANWLPVLGTTSYKVDVATDQEFLALVYGNVDVGNITTYSPASLSANTTYFLRVRSSNSSGASANSNVISVKTLSNVPTLAANGITFSSITATSAVMSFVPGNGSSHLVVLTTSTALGEVPVNGTSYAADAEFAKGATLGTGFIISTGLGPHTITGLSPATTYYAYVYEYNGAGGTENYLTTLGASNPAAVSTLAPTPASQPTALLFSNASASSVTVSFTSAANTPTGYLVLRSTEISLTDVPQNGNSYAVGTAIGASTVAYAGELVSFFDGGLATSKAYSYRIFAFNGTGKSISYLTTNPLSATVILDVESPQISTQNTNAPTITGGNTPIFTSVITDNVSVADAKIFYRGIAQKSYASAPLVAAGTNGNYTVQIQASWYDSLGMEYYFWAVDQNGNETAKPINPYQAQLVTSFNIPALPTGEKQSDYSIVAFPYQLTTGNKVTNVYSGIPWNDNTKAGLWWWDPTADGGAGSYSQYGTPNAFETVDPGKGYWMILRTPASPQLSNVAAPKYHQGNLFSMTLKPKWNEVGNPYPVPISWDDVIAYNQSRNPGAVFSKLSVYDGAGYKEATDGVLVKAFEGGFVNNLGSSDITIQIPFPGQINSGRTQSESVDIASDDWAVLMSISQTDMENKLGGFGMHPSAEPGADWFDNFNPPRFFGAPEINFTHAELPNVQFSKDIVKNQREHVWCFAPVGVDGQLTRLNWTSGLENSSSAQLILFDEQSLSVVDMEQTNEYEFVLHADSRFKIYFGNEVLKKITSSDVKAGLPYPNPLVDNTATTINLALPDSNGSYSVKLQLFNSRGTLVETMANTFGPGMHSLEIAANEPALMAGIYVYRLTVTSPNSSKIYSGKLVKP